MNHSKNVNEVLLWDSFFVFLFFCTFFFLSFAILAFSQSRLFHLFAVKLERTTKIDFDEPQPKVCAVLLSKCFFDSC